MEVVAQKDGIWPAGWVQEGGLGVAISIQLLRSGLIWVVFLISSGSNGLKVA